MRISDIGELRGEILLFGGVYSNLAAFDAVIGLAQACGIAPGQMICTGDVVAYCADAQIRAEIALLQTQVGHIDGVIAGHSALAMDRTVDGIRWINSGAVGMPPNDGDPRGAFAILSGDTVTFERFTYDPALSITAMQAAGLTQGYDRALQTGFWPSEDTMPPILRRQSSASG